jgi:hypothetical protein
MKRHEYIKSQAMELNRLCIKREKLSQRYQSGQLTHSAMQKLNAELNWLGMDISKTEERLSFALGHLLPQHAIKEYNPSAFHKYEGIGKELERTKFER